MNAFNQTLLILHFIGLVLGWQQQQPRPSVAKANGR